MKLPSMKRFAESTARRMRPRAARPRRRPIDRLILLALVPGPISRRIEDDLDASRDALTEAGLRYVSGPELDVAVPPHVWSRYLRQPRVWQDEVDAAIGRIANVHLASGGTGLLVGGESILGAEPWGRADRPRLRPSAEASLRAWADLVPARRTTVAIASLEADVLRSELADGLGGSGATGDRETIEALAAESCDFDDLEQRIRSEGHEVVRIPVDRGIPDRIRFFDELSEMLGVELEMPPQPALRRAKHRATVRATAALDAAIGTGDLLTDDEVRSLGTFLNRTLRSKFDSDVTNARRRHLGPGRPANLLLEAPVMPHPISAESAVALNPRPRLLVHASPPPMSVVVDAHLSEVRSALHKHNILWVPIDKALTDPNARGWYLDGYEQGNYRNLRADLLVAAEQEAEGLAVPADITWIVTIDLGKEPSPRGESARLTRSLGARVIDIIDALGPASCSIMAQLVRPDRVESPPELSQDWPIWSAERPAVDYEALARGLLTIPAVDVHVETVDTPRPDYASALQRLSAWMGIGFEPPATLNLDESQTAVAVELAPEHRAKLDMMFLAWLDRPGNPDGADDTVTTSST